MFNKFDVLRLVVLVVGMVMIFNTIGYTCGVEQDMINLTQMR